MTEQASLALRPWQVRLRAAFDAPLAAPLAVGALMLTAFIARVLLSRDVLAPWAMLDELQYAEAARSFISGGHYLFRDEPRPLRTIYPVLISPAWLAGSVQTSYMIVKVINSVLMVLGAIPLYLWSRRLVAPLWGVLVVALYLAMPGFIYTSEILTENAYVPATVLALYAIAVAIERQSLRMQALALGAIGLAACARIQGLILLAVLFTAIVISVVFDAVAADPGARRRVISSRLRRFWPCCAHHFSWLWRTSCTSAAAASGCGAASGPTRTSRMCTTARFRPRSGCCGTSASCRFPSGSCRSAL